MGMTKRELIDMFKNEIFPSQARHLKNVNYEGKGEVDEQEYLRDTAILIDLAEKGLDYEARLRADKVAMLTELQLEIEECENCGKAFHLGLQMASNIIQQKINELKAESEG